jgi:hypothetical protein
MENANDAYEYSPMEVAMSIALQFIQTSFGVLGSQEFRIEDVRHHARSNAWKVLTVRSIDGLHIRYEVTVDLVHQRPTRFRRLR